MENTNVVVLTGNLTRDPELRHLASGTSLCELRVAVNTRQKVEGEWTDKPNYFDVTLFGARGEAVAKYLSKGSPVAINGRLDWREWEAKDGSKRQAVQIIADRCEFLGKKAEGAKERPEEIEDRFGSETESSEFAPVGAGVGGGGAEDDIPF